MPNYKGTREGLGFNRDCVICNNSFEIYSIRQIRCRKCAHAGKSIPVDISIKRGNKVYVSKIRKEKLGLE